MFRIAAASRRLALLKSNPSSSVNVSVRLFQQTAIKQHRGSPRAKISRDASLEAGPKLEDAESLTNDLPGGGAGPASAIHNQSIATVREPSMTEDTQFQHEKSAPSIPAKKRGRKAKPKVLKPEPAGEEKVDKRRRTKKKPLPDVIVRTPETILQVLQETSHLSSNIGKRTGSKRMNVISKSLCNDTIERLKPSLEAYKGCDIIDINPGAGVWSSTLHDHLNPRNHILMEPDIKAYGQLLQPLIDEPNSTYKLVPQSGIIWGHLEKILTKEFLPHQEELPRGDPRLSQPNTSLLVIANLGYNPRKPYKGFASLSQLVLYQFLNAVKANSLFHRYGLIRILLWVNDEEKSNILPRSLRYRGKSAIEMEFICPKFAEVASSTQDSTVHNTYRDPKLDVEGLQQVLKRMEQNGIVTPPGRESVLMQSITEGTAVEMLKAWKTRPTLLAELQGLQGAGVKVDEYGEVSGPNQADVTRYRSLMSSWKSSYKKSKAILSLVDNYRALLSLEKEVYNQEPSEKLNAKREMISRQWEEWHKGCEEIITGKNSLTLNTMIENVRCFDERILLWDRREFEPLRAHPEEFYPPDVMACFDIQPTSPWPILQDSYPQNDEILEFIVAQLSITPTQSLKKGLTALWPGAFEWFAEHCPSLTDPRKGGWPDLNKMPVRLLTSEMYREMLEAWVEWPWKPSRWDIMHKLGSEQYDPDSVELDE